MDWVKSAFYINAWNIYDAAFDFGECFSFPLMAIVVKNSCIWYDYERNEKCVYLPSIYDVLIPLLHSGNLERFHLSLLSECWTRLDFRMELSMEDKEDLVTTQEHYRTTPHISLSLQIVLFEMIYTEKNERLKYMTDKSKRSPFLWVISK